MHHEWLVKTYFSFLQGASSPSDLLSYAMKLGYASVCINDFDGVYGLARAHREMQRLKKEYPENNMVLHHGAEIHLSRDHDHPMLLQDTVVLIAENQNGYQNLCKILTFSHRNTKDHAFVSIEDLVEMDLEGLTAIAPMRGVIRCGDWEKRHVSFLHAFKEKFYFALSLHDHPSEDLWVKKVLHLSKKYKVKNIFAQDVFFHRESEKVMSDLLMAIKNNVNFNQAQEFFFPNAQRCMQSMGKIEKRYQKIDQYKVCVQNSIDLASRCTFDLSCLSYHYPKEMIPDGYTPQAYLEFLVWKNAKEKFHLNIPSKVISTLEHELLMIQKLGFADYFLTVWDIVYWARSQGILCQGRGSAANSAVCFVLGITSVDPSQFDLLFERFMSMERGDPPDIDVDFEHERREEVVQYIYRRYGRSRAAMVANVITYRRRGAMRAVGKALGIKDQYLNQISQLASTKIFRRRGIENTIKVFRSDQTKNSDFSSVPWGLWIDLAQRLVGFPRHLGIHSGGFMISQTPIDHLVPQEPATMEARTVVQWSKEDIEGLGFFKIDVLCLGMLTAIRKCFSLIERHEGKKLTLYGFPYDDVETYRMIQKADTVGTFQIESRAQMSMLPRLKPENFYDLVIEVAIIRPGPIQGKVIHPYLKRREGVEKVQYPSPKLEPILKRTLGIPIFQEQAMRIAIAVGNFTPGEANELRKNIGVWNMKDFVRDLEPWLEKLKKGMRENQISEDFISQTIGQLKGFVHYGFPESHAVSFALIAYVSCYLKRHYPAQYFVSMLNSYPVGFYSAHALLQAAQRDGVSVLPICIQRSEWDHTLESSSEGRWSIRLGFRLVHGLSHAGLSLYFSHREKGTTWKNLDELLQMNLLSRLDATALAAANAFHVWGVSRSEALWKVQAIPYASLIDLEERKVIWKSEKEMEKIQKDFHSFKTSLGYHPTKILKHKHWVYPVSLDSICSSEKIVTLPHGKSIFSFGMTLVKQAPPSAKGMMFLTLEDEHGFINVVVQPHVYDQYYEVIEGEAFLCIQGILQRAGHHHSILLKKCYSMYGQYNLVSMPNAKKLRSLPEQPDFFDRLQKPRSYM
ncbi:MAG: error-prone DNA polymerase [Bdellovibrionota bacterium]